MLALTRRINERIVLHNKRTGEVIGYVNVVEIHGDKVRLSFEMPAHVGVDREELYIEKRRTADRARRSGR